MQVEEYAMHINGQLIVQIDEPINLIWATVVLGFGRLVLAGFAIHRGFGVRATLGRWFRLEVWSPKPPPDKN